MKNVSGDTVIGEQTGWLRRDLCVFLSEAGKNKIKHPRITFSFADGSNSFLKVSSNSGDIDVYVGDGGAAELHSQEGEGTTRTSVTSYTTFLLFVQPHLLGEMI